MNQDVTLLEESLLSIWNNRDAQERQKKMKEVYADDIVFYESNEGAPIVGPEAIDQLIVKLQLQWPATFQFELSSPVKVNNQVQLITWRLGPQGAPPAATGMDVAVIVNNKIHSLYLFIDQAVS